MTDDNRVGECGPGAEARPDISALASSVLSSLSDKSDEAARTIRASVVRKMVKATLRDGTFDADVLLNDLNDNRLGPDQIVDVYIPEAARLVGEMWQEDTIGFAQVTIASARLQGLLTALAPPWAEAASDHLDTISTLLILDAHDTHTLGPHVATAQLRRMGATVRILFGPDHQTVSRVLAEDSFDMVMFSCSRPAALIGIARMVKRIRALSDDAPPIALGGLVLNLADKVKERTGVDLVTSDVQVAYKLCDRKRRKIRPMAR